MRDKHYPGFKTLAGESIRYVAVYQGDRLALLSWSAAALECKARDQWIGWSLKWTPAAEDVFCNGRVGRGNQADIERAWINEEQEKKYHRRNDLGAEKAKYKALSKHQEDTKHLLISRGTGLR